MNNESLPNFKYSPNVYDIGVVEFADGICNCCGKKVNAYVSSMYTRDDVDCICMNCIASGEAARKFDGSFIQDADQVDNDEAIDELYNRTPGYLCWQGENWAACCNDYCEYIGTVGTKELEALGIADELFEPDVSFDGMDDVREFLVKDGGMCGYLFRCLHCGKYKLRVDMD